MVLKNVTSFFVIGSQSAALRITRQGSQLSPSNQRMNSVSMAWMRIPTKPAMHSNSKPAGDSDLKPATLAWLAWVVGDDVVWSFEGQVAGWSEGFFFRRLSPLSSMR